MPLLRGRDVHKYYIEDSDLFLIGTFPSMNLNIEDYPSIKKHLEQYLPKLNQTGETFINENGKKERTRKKTSGEWFETQDSISYWEDFEKPKIVWGEISDKPKFAFEDAGYYAEATTFLMTGEKLKFLLAILNSKVSEWYFNLIGTTTGMGTNRWKKYKIELLPIKVPTESQEQTIEILVNEILSIKKRNASADTTDLENEIDQLVYQLYDLTEEEIEIIENG